MIGIGATLCYNVPTALPECEAHSTHQPNRLARTEHLPWHPDGESRPATRRTDPKPTCLRVARCHASHQPDANYPRPRVTRRTSPQTIHLPQPWLAIVEFPSFDDAKAFQTLVAECLGESAQVRRKLEYRKQGAFAEWRTTRIFRQAFLGRSFTSEMLAEVAVNNGYAGTVSSISTWLRKASQEELIFRIATGTWEFLPKAEETLPEAREALRKLQEGDSLL